MPLHSIFIDTESTAPNLNGDTFLVNSEMSTSEVLADIFRRLVKSEARPCNEVPIGPFIIDSIGISDTMTACPEYHRAQAEESVRRMQRMIVELGVTTRVTPQGIMIGRAEPDVVHSFEEV